MKAMMILLLVVTASFSAGWVTLTPSGDAYIAFYDQHGGDEYDEYADDNFGDADILWLMYHEDQISYSYYYPFINFDISPYAGDALLDAELRVYFEYAPDGDQSLYLVDGAWEEMTITYNNHPMAATWLLAMDQLTTGWNTIDIDTADLQPYLTNPAQFYGFRMFDTQYWYSPIPGRFHSRENTNPPELRLYLSGAAVEETSWGQLKTGL